MKYLLVLSVQLFFIINLFSQTIRTPDEIQVGQSANPISEAGAIRWSGTDFEGYTGTEWVSFTKTNPSVISNSFSSNIWGKAIISSYEDQFVIAPDANHEDAFGWSVDIDGNVAVVGALGDDEKGVDAGAAYIFERENGIWVFKAKLTPSTVAAFQYFGCSVGISGETVVVGAYRTGNYIGAAYVYEKPVSGWFNMTETAVLSSSDLSASDHFGFSVAIKGSDIIVGGHGNDVTFSNTGSAYIFEMPPDGWVNATETAKLIASDASTDDWFGYSVDISNEIAVIGARYGEVQGANTGSAYIFEKPNSGWVNSFENHEISTSDAVTNDLFGNAVAIDSSIIVVGAPGDDSNFGAAYVFVKAQNGWSSTTENAKLIAGDRWIDFFGWRVAIGNNAIAVGTPDQDYETLVNTGAVYIFESENEFWENQIGCFQLIGSNFLSSGNLGRDIAISGNTLLSGANLANSANGNTGKALFYDRK